MDMEKNKTIIKSHKWLHSKTTAMIFVIAILIAAVAYLFFREPKERVFTVEDYIRLKDKPLCVSVVKEYRITPEMTEGTRYYESQWVTLFGNTTSQTDNTPNNTASGEIVCVGIIAPSQDLYGTEIRNGDLVRVVKANKWFEARCTMNQRKSNQFDVFFYKEMIPDLEKHPLWKQPFESDIYVIRLKQDYPYKNLFRVKGDKEESMNEINSKRSKIVQKQLKLVGCYKGEIDGVIGKGTIEAVKKFQKQNKLEATGVVDSKTWKKLSGGKE